MRFRRNRRTADLRKFQAIYNKIIQKQFQMRMIKKHPKKDIYIYIYIYIYIQKKDKRLLII